MPIRERKCACGKIEGIPDDVDEYECRKCGRTNRTDERYCYSCEKRVEHIRIIGFGSKCIECRSPSMRL